MCYLPNVDQIMTTEDGSGLPSNTFVNLWYVHLTKKCQQGGHFSDIMGPREGVWLRGFDQPSQVHTEAGTIL